MIVVYTKAACQLCDELKDLLHAARIPFEERDITTRHDWFEPYKHRVPVLVTANGAEHDPPFSADRIARLTRL